MRLISSMRWYGVSIALPSPSRVWATFSRLNEGKLQVAERSASMPSMIKRPLAAAKKCERLPCSRHSITSPSRPRRSGTCNCSAWACNTRRSNCTRFQPIIASGSCTDSQWFKRSSNCARLSQYSRSKSMPSASPLAGPSMYTWRWPQPSRAMEYSSPRSVVSISSDTSFSVGR
ncbi:hypothetical protein D3C84_804950 [compost metagenome]